VKYHPILLMMDEDRITTAARVDGFRSANPEAIRAYTLWLTDRVGENGIRSCKSEVQRLVRVARSSGVRCVALDVLADPAEPAVARERALGQVITAIFQLRDEPPAADAA
jgi:hypothetical protein